MGRSRAAVAYLSLPAVGGGAAGPALASQRRALGAFLRARSWVLIEPFVAREGRRDRVPSELATALARCREEGAVLVVASLAQLGGDVGFLEAVLASGVRFAAVDAPGANRRTLALLRAVAEHERDRRASRTRVALAGARRRGVRLGSPRPEVGSRAAVAELRRRADARAESVRPWLEELRLGNPDASLRDLAAALDAIGIPTPRGGRWGPSAVRNALARRG